MYAKWFSALAFLLFSLYGYAQEETKLDKKNLPDEVPTVTKTNLLAILWGPIPITAEYRLVREVNIGEYQSVQFGVSYLGKNPMIMLGEAFNNPTSTFSYNNPITICYFITH